MKVNTMEIYFVIYWVPYFDTNVDAPTYTSIGLKSRDDAEKLLSELLAETREMTSRDVEGITVNFITTGGTGYVTKVVSSHTVE